MRKDLDIVLNYILVEIVLIINYTITLNRTGKDFSKIDSKLFLETLASLLLIADFIDFKANLNKVVKDTIIAI
jgi:hypothetical protein